VEAPARLPIGAGPVGMRMPLVRSERIQTSEIAHSAEKAKISVCPG
jgi:hypothetical protein